MYYKEEQINSCIDLAQSDLGCREFQLLDDPTEVSTEVSVWLQIEYGRMCSVQMESEMTGRLICYLFQFARRSYC